MSSLIYHQSDADFLARVDVLLARSRSLRSRILHQERQWDPEMTVGHQRTGTRVPFIDLNRCGDENGHDDSEDGYSIQQRDEDGEIDPYEKTRNGSPSMYNFDELGLVLANLPITHELQDHRRLAELYERGERSDWDLYLKAINKAEDYGLDQDLVDQTDLLLGMASIYWLNGPTMAPRSDYF